jgi:hypothetical protein
MPMQYQYMAIYHIVSMLIIVAWLKGLGFRLEFLDAESGMILGWPCGTIKCLGF